MHTTLEVVHKVYQCWKSHKYKEIEYRYSISPSIPLVWAQPTLQIKNKKSI